jgi:hypothetical protein
MANGYKFNERIEFHDNGEQINKGICVLGIRIPCLNSSGVTAAETERPWPGERFSFYSRLARAFEIPVSTSGSSGRLR